MKTSIATKSIPHCASCGGLAKPEIVFFGEALPERFFKTIYSLRDADLLFIMGTSLTVHPFASLCDLVPDECPRVLINWDEVGDIGERDNDVLLLGDCDEMVSKICDAIGWGDELRKLWEDGKGSIEQAESDRLDKAESAGKEPSAPPAEEAVKELTEKIDTALKLTEGDDTKDKPSDKEEPSNDTAKATTEPETAAPKSKDDQTTDDTKGSS